MARLKIPAPSSMGLVLSYKCSAECRHCMYACSPRWNADWISEEDLRTCLRILKGKIRPGPWGKDSIGLSQGLHFTGGEPFLNFDLLLKAAEIAADFQIPSTFVETNCSWCTSEEETRRKLTLLRERGLKGIMISVNPFYAEYIPFENTERCIAASLEVFGENTAVYQLEYYSLFKRLGVRGRITLKEYLSLTGYENPARGVEMFLMGKAAFALRSFYPSHPARAFFDEPCQPPFIRDWHNHLDNYGNFIPGFCGGIALGRWQDLESLINEGIDLDRHPILNFLASGDMQGLFAFAAEHGFRESDAGYISKCDLCLDIRRHLVSVADWAELKPKQFYDNL